MKKCRSKYGKMQELRPWDPIEPQPTDIRVGAKYVLVIISSSRLILTNFDANVLKKSNVPNIVKMRAFGALPGTPWLLGPTPETFGPAFFHILTINTFY